MSSGCSRLRLLRVLAKDPSQRYADADELIAALEYERQALPALHGATAADGHAIHPAPAAAAAAAVAYAGAGSLLLATPGTESKMTQSVRDGIPTQSVGTSTMPVLGNRASTTTRVTRGLALSSAPSSAHRANG